MTAMHVDSSGSGAPLVMLHGWGMHGGMWGSAAKHLARHVRVMAVDLPGHGYSVPPSPLGRGAGGEGLGETNEPLSLTLSPRERGLSLDFIVDELSAQFNEPITVCGWSLGGQIALRWAMRHPQQVNRLVLVASTPCFVQRLDWPCAMAAETLHEFSAALLQNYRTTLKRFVALQVRGSEHERELLADFRERLFSRGEPDRAALVGGLAILRDTDLRAVLPQITQPALVISGERDTLTPPAASAYLAETLADACLVEIKGAAHAPFLSHPDIFVEHLMGFMHERI